MSGKTLIVTTGDCSDYDGFTAIPLYKAALARAGGGTLMFIINYPSFLREPVPANMDVLRGDFKIWNSDVAAAKAELDAAVKSFPTDPNQVKAATDALNVANAVIHNHARLDPVVDKIAHDGVCGYAYSADEFYTYRYADKVFDELYREIKGKCAMAEFPTEIAISETAKQACQMLTLYAVALATSIWENTKVQVTDGTTVDMQFTIGGINTVNGFSIAVYKNELAVYREIVSKIAQTKQMVMPVMHACDWLNKTKYQNIFMDMNGSMAWYRGASDWMQTLEGVYVMGGMPPPLTGVSRNNVTNAPPFLSRKTSCTFNQLYAPAQTKRFFEACAEKNINIFTVSNATCNLTANYESIYKASTAFTSFISSDTFKSNSSTKQAQEQAIALNVKTGGNALCVKSLTHMGIFNHADDAAAYSNFLTVPGAAPTVFDLVCAAKLAADIISEHLNTAVATRDIIFTFEEPSRLSYEVTSYSVNGFDERTVMEYFILDDINPPTVSDVTFVAIRPVTFAPTPAAPKYTIDELRKKDHNAGLRKCIAAIFDGIIIQGGGGGSRRVFKKTDERVSIAGSSRLRVVYVCKRTKYVIEKGEHVTLSSAQRKGAAAQKQQGKKAALKRRAKK